MTALFAVQLLHTVITIVIFACIGYLICAGFSRKRGRLVQLCLLVVVLEAMALALSGFRCPLHLLVINMTGNHHTPDILLPAWISKRIMKTGVLLATAGLLLHLRNHFTSGKT